MTEPYATSISNATDLCDLFGIVFHVDLGEGHLENYRSGQGLDLDLEQVSFSPSIVGMVIDVTSYEILDSERRISAFRITDDPYLDAPVLSSYLRGPIKCKDYSSTVDITQQWPLIGVGGVNRKMIFGTACQLPDGQWIEDPTKG